MQFPWRWNGGPISVNLEVIWEMSVEILDDTENGIVRVALVGEIQPTDCEVSTPTFEKIFETRKPLRLLLDCTRFLVGARNPSLKRSFFAYGIAVTSNELQLSVKASGGPRQPKSIRS